MRVKGANSVNVLILLLSVAFMQNVKGQGLKEVTPIIQKSADKDTLLAVPQDTLPIVLDESELNGIADIRAILDKQNKAYTVPFQPSVELLRFLDKDEPALPDEVMYWVNYVRDASTVFGDHVTFKDTIIVDPLFEPLVFKGLKAPDDLLTFDLSWKNPIVAYDNLYKPDTTLFRTERAKKRLRDMAYRYVEANHPGYFRYSVNDLLPVIQTAQIKSEPMIEPFAVTAELGEVKAPEKYRPKVRYWKTYAESSLQVYQNHITANWHKGGAGNTINLYMRNYGNFTYNKQKVNFLAELEWRESFFNAPNDTIRSYRIGEDFLRFHTYVGYQAFNDKWFYTLDGEFKTQLFANFPENSKRKLVAFLSPMSINLGPGMMFKSGKQFKNKHQNLSFSVNVSPLSVNYMYSRNKEIDLGRHGFQDGRNFRTNLVTRVNADMNFNLNKITRWTTRFVYQTSYERIEWELENTLFVAISRFFSTTINVNMRYDDGVTKREDYDHYLQINEKITFGFLYRW